MSEKNKQRFVTKSCAEPRLLGSFTVYLSKGASLGYRRRVDEHLSRCASCRKALSLFRMVKQIAKDQASKS